MTRFFYFRDETFSNKSNFTCKCISFPQMLSNKCFSDLHKNAVVMDDTFGLLVDLLKRHKDEYRVQTEVISAIACLADVGKRNHLNIKGVPFLTCLSDLSDTTTGLNASENIYMLLDVLWPVVASDKSER